MSVIKIYHLCYASLFLFILAIPKEKNKSLLTKRSQITKKQKKVKPKKAENVSKSAQKIPEGDSKTNEANDSIKIINLNGKEFKYIDYINQTPSSYKFKQALAVNYQQRETMSGNVSTFLHFSLSLKRSSIS